MLRIRIANDPPVFLPRSSRGLASRLRGKTDPVELEELCLRIDEALKQDEKIEDIEWLTFDEWLERP